MFGVDTTELLIVALAALIFIGPKELPGAMRTVGKWVGRARAHARHFTAGIENMMREAELEEMEKRWREENERIMREHPTAVPHVDAGGGSSAVATGDEASTAQTTLAFSEGHVFASSEEPASASLSTNDSGSDNRAGVDFADDEPGLPLPDPEHHRRELP